MANLHRRGSGLGLSSLAAKPRLWIAGGAALLASVGGVSVIASAALLSQSQTTGGASVTAGTVSLSLSGGSGSVVRGAPVTAWISATNVGVGTPNAYYKDLTVYNNGTAQLRYAMTSTPNGTGTGLTTTNEIELDIALITAGQTCSASTFAAGTTITPSTAVMGNGTNTTEVAVIGDKTAGQSGTDGGVGDQVLPVGASDTLCMRAYVIPGAGRAAQAVSSITSTFTFYSEQTKNNP
jgi:hypothetical protein